VSGNKGYAGAGWRTGKCRLDLKKKGGTVIARMGLWCDMAGKLCYRLDGKEVE